MERPAPQPRVRETDLVLFETVWNQYFLPIVKQRGLTEGEIRTARGIFLETCANRKLRGWTARQMIEAAQDMVAPYIKPRNQEIYVEKCDYCGRPHVDNKSQCPGCGVWRKQYR